MNIVDIVLGLVVIAYAISGYWQGFIAGAFATVGLLVGGIFGIWVTPQVLGSGGSSLLVPMGALFIVMLSASFGQAFFQFVGRRVRAMVRWQPVRAVDAVGGAALSVSAVLVVAWVLGTAVTGSQLPGISPMVRDSRVLTTVNGVMPQGAHELLRSFDRVVGASVFPRYLEPFAPERIVEVEPPPTGIAAKPAIRQARKSVFKIRSANRCNQGVEGTGFLYAPHRIMTNAHVVAGVTDPQVWVKGQGRPATVVYYNSDLDIAVLSVDFTGPTLELDQTATSGDPGVMLGFPNDGPFKAQAVRVRAEQRLRSPDIYGRGSVMREVFSLRGRVQPGNSGGPVVSTNGKVVGVIFAASVSDKTTGYALTARQVAQAAAAGMQSEQQVSSGNCA